LRTIQAEGIKHLKDGDRQKYVPPIGGGLGATLIPMVQQLPLADILPRSSVPYGQGPYQLAEARVVSDHTMAQVKSEQLIFFPLLGFTSQMSTLRSHHYH
jgi:hypothetical protein